jgi:hypothetical protein
MAFIVIPVISSSNKISLFDTCLKLPEDKVIPDNKSSEVL